MSSNTLLVALCFALLALSAVYVITRYLLSLIFRAEVASTSTSTTYSTDYDSSTNTAAVLIIVLPIVITIRLLFCFAYFLDILAVFAHLSRSRHGHFHRCHWFALALFNDTRAYF